MYDTVYMIIWFTVSWHFLTVDFLSDAPNNVNVKVYFLSIEYDQIICMQSTL